MINLGLDPKIIQYQGIIFSIVAKYANPQDPEEFEDLVMSGVEGMYYAISTYKKSKGASLATHIYIHARDFIQREKNSSLMVKISCPTAAKKGITLYKGNAGRELLRQEETKNLDQDDPLSLLMAKEEEMIKIGLYNNCWRKLNFKFDNQERNLIIDYFVHGKSIRFLNNKYKLNSFNIITRVKEILKPKQAKQASDVPC
jgi:hypothetical protein